MRVGACRSPPRGSDSSSIWRGWGEGCAEVYAGDGCGLSDRALKAYGAQGAASMRVYVEAEYAFGVGQEGDSCGVYCEAVEGAEVVGVVSGTQFASRASIVWSLISSVRSWRNCGRTVSSCGAYALATR
jgi:hypothetical protein